MAGYVPDETLKGAEDLQTKGKIRRIYDDFAAAMPMPEPVQQQAPDIGASFDALLKPFRDAVDQEKAQAQQAVGQTGDAFGGMLESFKQQLGQQNGTATPMPTASGATGFSGGSQPTYSGSGAPAGDGEIEQYIRQAAIKRGIDPDIAVAVANSEGGVTEPARRGTFQTGSSWWPFQLHYGGAGYEHLGDTAGMGNDFTARTGIAPGDPNGWRQSVDYALDQAKAGGWGPWYGAKAIGVTGMQGIGQPGSAAMLADNAPDTANPPLTKDGGSDVGGLNNPTVPNGTIKGMPVADALRLGGQFQLGGPDDGSGVSGGEVRTSGDSSYDTGYQDGAITGQGNDPLRMGGQPNEANNYSGSDSQAMVPPVRDNAWASGDLSQPVASAAEQPDWSASPPSGAQADPGAGAPPPAPVEQPQDIGSKLRQAAQSFGDTLASIFGGGDQNTAPEAPQRPATAGNFNLPAAESRAQNAASVAPPAEGLPGISDFAGKMRDEQDALMAEYYDLSGRSLGISPGGPLNPEEEWRLAQLTKDVGMGTFAGGLEGIGKLTGTGIASAGRRGVREAIEAGAPGAERAAATTEPSLSERAGDAIKGLWPTAGRAVPEMASGVVSGADNAPQYDRYYHGTGGDFARPDPGKFDPNGLVGPAYYMTDEPTIAGTGDALQHGYAEARGNPLKTDDPWIKANYEDAVTELDRIKRQWAIWGKRPESETAQKIKSQMDAQTATVEQFRAKLDEPFQSGPNVRPIDVPRDLNLFDVDQPAPSDIVDRLRAVLPDDGTLDAFESGVQDLRKAPTGADIYNLIPGGKAFANKALAEAGYDGIKYRGGNLTPLLSDDGKAIKHNAIAIFPESLDKIRNATAGTPGGFVPRTPPSRGSGAAVDEAMVKLGVNAAQGGVAGAVGEAQNDPNATPATIGKAALMGATQRVLLGNARGVLGPRNAGTITRAVKDAGRAVNEALPIELTDAQEARRINIDKLVPDGVDQSVKDLIINNANSADWFHNQRRGVRPDELVAHDAQAINDAKNVDDWIRGGKAGKNYNPEETVALRNAYLTQAQVVDDLSKRYMGELKQGEREQVLAEYLNESAKLRGLAEVAEGARAEAGRTLRQYGEWGKLLEADPTVHARRYLDKLYGGTDGAEEVLKNFQQMQLDGASPQALAGFLRQTGNPNFMQRWGNRLQIIRYANMLSGTLTHIINTEGTLLNAAAEAGPVKAGAVAIDMARVGLDRFFTTGGTRAEREVFAGEILPQLRGGLAGTLEGVRQIPGILKTGVSIEDATKLEHLNQGFASGSAVVDTIVESPLRLLQAEDALTKSISRGGHLAELATRQALKEGLKGSAVESRMREILSDPVTNWKIYEQATDLARRDAFQETRALTTWLAQGKNLGGVVGAVFNTIMPFTKTPTNIAAQGLGYTPLGFLDVLKSARAGNTGEAEMAASRAMLGTGVTYLGVNLATSGYLTGDFPKDEAERSTLPPGWKPWSVRIPKSDGTILYMNYSNMGPVGIPLAIGAIIGDAMKRGDDPSSWIPQAAVGTGKFMTDSTFLQGLSQFTAALTDSNKVENFSEGLATQWMPAAAMQRQVQNALGMAQRDPHGAIEALLATSPLTAERVPERQDRLGRTMYPTQTGVGAVAAPVRYGVSKEEPVLDAFREAGVTLSAPPKFITDETVKAPLSREEQSTYQTYVGDILERRIRPGMSEQRVKDIYEEAKKQGHDYMVRQIGRGEIRARARGDVSVK